MSTMPYFYILHWVLIFSPTQAHGIIEEAKCLTDQDCFSSEACINGVCTDPCQLLPYACGFNANCEVIQHKAMCQCPKGWIGDPNMECVLYECQTDSDCSKNRACKNHRCINPCIFVTCGFMAFCHVEEHKAKCLCPPGVEVCLQTLG